MALERTIFESEHETFREHARRFFIAEVEPHAERFRAQGCVDPALFCKAGERGLLFLWADPAYGGAGIADFRYEQILIEENARHGESGFFMTLHSRLCGPYLGELGSAVQKQRFIPGCVSGERILGIAMTEPGAGSDLAGMRSRAERRGDLWVLNGSKTYISNGQIGNLFIVAARTDPDRRHGLGLFLVEAGMPGFRRGRRLAKMGLHAQDTSELFFEDVALPVGNVLGDPLAGFGYLTRFLVDERLIGACQSIAAAQVAFDLTLDFIRTRRAFGQPIGSFQDIRFRMAKLRAEIDALQSHIDVCVLAHNASRLSAEGAAGVKLLATELEGRVMDECVQFHGGAGYMDEYRISRLYTDARVSRIYAGSSEIMKEIIARSLGLDERKLR
jgi:acyl-CoA dehydrogenase